MMDHDDILRCFLELDQAQSVHLLARTTVAGAAVTTGKVWVIIPDLHLLTAASARGYRYSFVHDVDGPVAREALLRELTGKLASLREREPNSVYAFQVGDLIDVWRENASSPIEDLDSLAQRVLDDNPAARDCLVDARFLGTSLVLGNHDHVGELSLARDAAFRRMGTAFGLPPNGGVVVTHGDLFDRIELLPDPWSRWGARFTSVFGSKETEFPAAKLIQRREDVPDELGVTDHHEHSDEAISTARRLRNGDRDALRRFGFSRGYPVSIFVIGHTHSACLAVEDDLVVMDCGAWIERCVIEGSTVPSCQVGVIAQCDEGTDLRIYQLTPG